MILCVKVNYQFNNKLFERVKIYNLNILTLFNIQNITSVTNIIPYPSYT